MGGFARVGIGFLAAVAGIRFGFWFYYVPAGWVHSFASSKTFSNLAGFFIVFFAFVVAGSVIGRMLAKLFRWTGLSWLDRLLGAAFGFIRGSIIAAVFVTVLLAFTPTPPPNWMVDSMVLPYVMGASHVASELAPAAIKDAFRASMDELRKIWEEEVKRGKGRPKRDEEKKSDDSKTGDSKKPLKKVEF
jgi:membrane protein required for colicin V production